MCPKASRPIALTIRSASAQRRRAKPKPPPVDDAGEDHCINPSAVGAANNNQLLANRHPRACGLAKVAPDDAGEDLKERTVDAIRAALEAAGVGFTNGAQPGVCA